MDSSSSQVQPLLKALLLFCVLITLIILLAIFVDIPASNAKGLLFILALLCAIFASKNLYDNERAADYSVSLEKNLAENLIFASRELYTELFQNSPVPYFLITLDGEVKSANLAGHRMLGLRKGQEVGLNVFRYIHCEESSHLEILINKYQNRIPVSDEMVTIINNKGKETWALLSLFHFVTKDQHLGLLTLVDITKQKQIENAKAEFVSLASHQLRTPIAGIKWSAELLQLDGKDTLTDRQKKYVDRLLAAAKRMAVLVDDFLRVSRFELGTFQPDFTSVNLKDIIEEVLSDYAERIGQKKITVKTFYDESGSEFISDQNLVRMMVTNLLSNAIKYTREQGAVHIGYRFGERDVTFSVADNGMGIPAEDQEHVFSKLYRASNALRSVPDGTGLGLYIVKESVEVLKGTVTFTSTENQGTTFEIVLPMR